VSFPARKILTKLFRMSWDEFRTRVGQELGKRAEYMTARAGLLPSDRHSAMPGSNGGNFFFSAKDVQSRVSLLKEFLPDSIEHTIKEADEILQHRFRLLGYRDLDYGSSIDWHLDAVHGKRAPLKPWYTIRFLDFAEVGDHKVTWELNRHQHLITLARAFAFTRDQKYIREIEEQFYSWQRSNPYPLGINWGSSLEVAFRSMSWIWVRNLLPVDSIVSPEFHADLLRGLARNGRYIERYLSTYFSPNTHLIGEALALFIIGTVCPEISASPRWKQRGFDILLSEIQHQVRPDGVYFEQSLYYHVYALDLFLHARALAARNGLRLPDSFDDSLHKMLRVLNILCSEGSAQSFGDDDGGRLFDRRRNHAGYMSDPLALGACLFADLELNSAALTEESVWIFGEQAVHASRKDAREVSPASFAFEDGGLYVIASQGHVRSQMLIDAGPHGTGHGGHGHADALSVRLSVDGQPWLIDPGTYVYISPDDARNEFRGTAAHNTLRVDKLDQAVPETAFSWSSLPEVTTDKWIIGDGFTLFSGSHNGYRRFADPVHHRRSIFHLNGEYWLVRDVADGRTEHDLEIYWHFAPGTRVVAQDGMVNAWQNGEQLALLTAGSWDCSVVDGFVSPAYGERQPARVAVLQTRTQLPAEHATMILPLKAYSGPGTLRTTESTSPISAYIYERADHSDELIFSNGEKWSLGSISSDAEFVFVRRSGREISSLVLCAATFMEIDGQVIFSSPEQVNRVEWSAARGASCSDPKSLQFFHGELVRAGSPVR
jgi:hypothetical protein